MHPLSLLAQDDSGSGSGLFTLLLPVLLIVGMYFVLIRPQRKRMREQNAMQSSIEQGDEVITSSGIYGFISAVEDKYFWLEIDDDVQIRIAKAAIQSKVDTSAGDDDDEDDDDEDES
jgi:preprotein translocase subunit YajC